MVNCNYFVDDRFIEQIKILKMGTGDFQSLVIMVPVLVLLNRTGVDMLVDKDILLKKL